MTHENQNNNSYNLPPLADPEKGPEDLANQLYGEDYDQAKAAMDASLVDGVQAGQHVNYLIASLAATEGRYISQYGVRTPEGMAVVTTEHAVLEPDEVEQAEADYDVFKAKSDAAFGRIGEIAPRLWQETGLRLFTAWQAGELDPKTALDTYQRVWNEYSPDDFYVHCGVDKAEVVHLFSDAVKAYAESSKAARQLPDNEIEADFIANTIQIPARSLGIDISQLGL